EEPAAPAPVEEPLPEGHQAAQEEEPGAAPPGQRLPNFPSGLGWPPAPAPAASPAPQPPSEQQQQQVKGEAAAGQEPAAAPPRMDSMGEDALDLSGGHPGKRGLMPSAAAASPAGMEIGEHRVVVCHRPPDTSYLSVTYSDNSPEPCASPRKRLGETAEIKAIQQTRRLLANARERTRVHTISAAFEALRKQVPCYSYGQKLSKLAILRIACNYILSLARLADLDYSADHSNLTFSDCVDQCTRTLQSEGRSKKRKV
ncbi:atonal homolog 8, partial [Pristimantis euphronides]